MSRRAAFTLIEVLIVMAIICLLSGMLMTLMSSARRAGKRTATLAVMHKVDTALRMFKADFKAYPWQRAYPDAGDDRGWTNRLYWHLGTDITADSDARDHVLADVEAAGAAYAYDCSSPWGRTENQPVSPQVFRTYRDGKKDLSGNWLGDDVPTGYWHSNEQNCWYLWYEDRLATCAMLNRMGAERARLLLLTGDVDACGVTMPDVPYPAIGWTHEGRDLSKTPIVPKEKLESGDKPGWAVDYLRGELDRRFIHGETVLDAYGHPLVYIYQAVPGVHTSQARLFTTTVNVDWLWAYGLGPVGRKTLSPDDPPDADGGLPDPTRLRHSDRTKYAAPGYEGEFELWSAGQDGRFGVMRDDHVNRDNIPLEEYDRGIP